METSVADPAWAAWYAQSVERERLYDPERPTEPYEPPEPPATFTWIGLPPQVLATVLDPQSRPEGVRLAMGTAAFIQQQMMLHKSGEALLGLRAMADMAGIHRDTVAKAEANQQTIVRVSNGTPLVIKDGHGDASAWTLVALDDPQAITVPVDPRYENDLNPREISDFFNPVNKRWSTKKGGMTSRSYWLVLALLLTHGATKVSVTTTQAAAMVGANRSTASRTMADIVTHLGDDAQRTSNGMEIDMGQMLDMDWGGYSDRDKEAARVAERAKWLDWQAIKDARKYLETIRAEPKMTDIVAWAEAHFDQVVANFRQGDVRDDAEPTPEQVPVAEPTDVDLESLKALRDRVRGIDQPMSPPSTTG